MLEGEPSRADNANPDQTMRCTNTHQGCFTIAEDGLAADEASELRKGLTKYHGASYPRYGTN